ncbi:MAG: hypothetical protein IPL79_08885 [Myxococcales bacterium]|nr:hypothetical protein [Myxococcales bacterium]
MNERWLFRGPSRSVALVVLFALAGCESQPIPTPSQDAAPLAPAFASAVIAYDEGDGEQDCGDMMPLCDELGTCGPTDLLGEPDEVAYVLVAGGFVEIAFLCSSMIERGVDASPELKLWATVPEGGGAIVQVSVDGATYDEIGVMNSETLEFDLARLELTDARFVRVLNTGAEAIDIDAFEALRNP